MELVSLNEGPENSLVCSVMAELREKLDTYKPKNGPHQDYGKYGSLFISHQVYGKLVYHCKRYQDLTEKSKRRQEKNKEETVWKEVVEMDSDFADPGVRSPKESMSVQKAKY